MEDQDQDLNSAEGTVQEQSAGHPAWKEILDVIPEELHDVVRPTLEKWDSGVNKRFQSLHSQYEPFKQFQDIDPEALQLAVSLMQRIEDDPKGVYDLMGQTYGFVTEQQGAEPEMGTEDFDLDEQDDPRLAQELAQLRSEQEQLRLQNEQLLQAQQNEQAELELEAYLEHLHDTQGDFDEDFVIALMANGIDGTQAVARFNDIISRASQQVEEAPPQAPAVMGSSGTVPSRQIDPVALSGRETKDLVAQMLEQALKE